MLTPPEVLVEVAVDSVATASNAAEAGAGRLELCQALEIGGLTPSVGLLRAVRRRVTIPVFVMIRHRAGHFQVDSGELDAMVDDVAIAVGEGADGIVTGVLDGADQIDGEGMRRLIEAAGALPVTFHRAFDQVADRRIALRALQRLGVRRILSSGGAPTAFAGREVLAALARSAEPPLTILPGGGIIADQVAELLRVTGCRELHLSGVMTGSDPVRGFGSAGRFNGSRVAAVLGACAAARRPGRGDGS